jgi:hypothetical protein
LKSLGVVSSEATIEVSLAEWSLHRAIYDGRLDHLDFPAVAKREFGISAVEYVNGFFGGKSMDFRAAAKVLGCRTVRVNLHGEGSAEEKKIASVDSLGRLGEFAEPMKINVVVENPGGVTSNGAWLADVPWQVARENVGIEYEGNTQPEDETIRKTKALLEKYL